MNLIQNFNNETGGPFVIRFQDGNGVYHYLQNRNLNRHRWWTTELDQSMKFFSRHAAEQMKSKYKFNSPTVIKL